MVSLRNMNVLVLRYTLDNQELANLSLSRTSQALACNFFIPRRGSFSPFPAFYCPASAICSRVMGSS